MSYYYMKVDTMDVAEKMQVETSVICTQDRRITRSKKALRDALISLMEEKGYESLTVGDLCVRADLNRGTFYNHYQDKDELLSSLEDEVMAGLDSWQQGLDRFTIADLATFRLAKEPLPVLVELFDYLREVGDFLHAVLGSGGDITFGPRLSDSVCRNLLHSILNEQYRTNTNPFVNYYVAYYAAAHLGVIMRWIEMGMRESSEEMALIVMRLLFIRPGEPIRL